MRFAVLLLIVSMFAGCAGPSTSVKTVNRHGLPASLVKNDVYKVVCVFPQTMWQSYDQAGDSNPEGFRFLVYLLSKSTRKGAYADGFLHVKMFRMDQMPDGRNERVLVQNWMVGTEELPRRESSKLTGYSYQPSLYWGDVDILGETVEIVVQYESLDGKTIQSQTKQVRVPRRKS